jgi:hypothetical protein
MEDVEHALTENKLLLREVDSITKNLEDCKQQVQNCQQ